MKTKIYENEYEIEEGCIYFVSPIGMTEIKDDEYDGSYNSWRIETIKGEMPTIRLTFYDNLGSNFDECFKEELEFHKKRSQENGLTEEYFYFIYIENGQIEQKILGNLKNLPWMLSTYKQQISKNGMMFIFDFEGM